MVPLLVGETQDLKSRAWGSLEQQLREQSCRCCTAGHDHREEKGTQHSGVIRPGSRGPETAFVGHQGVDLGAERARAFPGFEAHKQAKSCKKGAMRVARPL